MYELKTRFSELNEKSISYAREIRLTRDKREIEFENKLTFDEIKIEIKKHYKENNGKVEYFGEILYYEWYENGNIFYKFDIDGNLIESTKFASPKFKEIYNKTFKIVKKAMNEIDPFNKAWANENIYESEIEKLSEWIADENFDKEEIFKAIKIVFDSPHFNDQKKVNIPKYKKIAEKISDEIIKDLSMKSAKEIVEEAEVVIITAGAGMGVDSGLPDFRGDEGMWKAYPALGKRKMSFSKIANPRAFEYKPKLAWGFYGHRYDLYKNITPHKGFNALLELVKTKEDYFVVTSNVDGHFQKAGFDLDKIYEIHGRIRTFQCTVCNNIWTPPSDLEFNVNPETLEFEVEIPRCKCGEVARPNIVMFNDYFFNSYKNNQQNKRFESFMDKYTKGNTKIVILEFGAGTAIPTIRMKGEAIQKKIPNATLIRVNPKEAQGPEGIISIAKGALDAIFEDLVSDEIKKIVDYN